MWAHVCTCGHLMYRCVHMCRVYVARSGRDQRILVALPLPPLPIPFSGPLIFHLCCFWMQKSKGRATETLTHRVAAYREGAVWVRVYSFKWL